LPSDTGKIEKYLKYVEELRALARHMANPKSQALVLSVADAYERLAKTLDKQGEEP
jgi:hypothetical protein